MQSALPAIQAASTAAWIDAVGYRSERPISVITATKDRPHLLAEAARSVIHQDSSGWEWVVVNDGEPGSCNHLLDYSSSGVIRVVESGGVGLAAARNQGLQTASSEYVCYLDDDNLLHPTWLRSLNYALDRAPSAVWGYGARIVETPEVIRDSRLEQFPYLELPEFSQKRLQHGNYIDANTIFHQRDRFAFDANTGSLSDWELLLRLSESSPPLRVPAVACFYRTEGHARMSRGEKRFADVAYIRGKHRLR